MASPAFSGGAGQLFDPRTLTKVSGLNFRVKHKPKRKREVKSKQQTPKAKASASPKHQRTTKWAVYATYHQAMKINMDWTSIGCGNYCSDIRKWQAAIRQQVLGPTPVVVSIG